MKLIDCTVLSLDRFGIEEGYQPTDAFFYILKGCFSLDIDGKEETVGENELVFFPSDMRFSRRALSPLCFYYVKLESEGAALPRGRVRVEDRARLLSSLFFLSSLDAREGEAREHYLRDVFVQLYAEGLLCRPPADRIAARAEEYFEEHLAEKILLSDAARAAGASVSSLISHFKAARGVTPMRYLSKKRISRAESLLLSTDKTLEELAEATGFDNAFYLSQAFKAAKGLSPREYRRKYKV